MKDIELNTSVQMPNIGFEAFEKASGELYRAVRWALKLGYTFFDCDSSVKCSSEIGQALRDAFDEDRIRRHDLFLSARLAFVSDDVKDASEALSKTISSLGADYLDLVLVPVRAEDPASDVVLWNEMIGHFREGSVKSLGVVCRRREILENLIEQTDVVPAVCQLDVSPLDPQTEMLDFCLKNNIAVLCHHPFGETDAHGRPSLFDYDVIRRIAERLESTEAQIILSWHLARHTAVLIRTGDVDCLRENRASLTIELDEADREQIDLLGAE